MDFGQGKKRLNRPSKEVIDGDYNQGSTGTQPTTNEVKAKGHIVIPYTQGDVHIPEIIQYKIIKDSGNLIG